MLRVSMEEMTALNLVLQFCSVSELLSSAMKGFVDATTEESEITLSQKEKSDLCWKVLKTLQ